MRIPDDIFSIIKEIPQLKSAVDAWSSDVSHIYPFGCPPLDIILGGGLYSGKIYEIFGWESQGKSTIALEATKAFSRYWESRGHKKYGILWLETESSLDKVRAKWMNCPIERFLENEVENIEDGHEIIKNVLNRCIEKDMKMLIVWDTIGATSTRKEKEKGANSGGMAERARLARQMFRDITVPLGKTDSTLILVNQSQMSLGGFGPTDDTPIPAIKFHASVRMRLNQKGLRKVIKPDGTEQVVGIYTEVFTIKNKLTLPKQKQIISIYGESGLDIFDTVFTYLVDRKLISISGSWKQIEFPEKTFNEFVSEISMNKKISESTKSKGSELTKEEKIKALTSENHTKLTEEEINNIQPKMISLKFQSASQLKEKIETQYPILKDWIDYLIYKDSSSSSPLLKVKIINTIWDYELKFFGKKKTPLTDKEKEVASILYKELQKEVETED